MSGNEVGSCFVSTKCPPPSAGSSRMFETATNCAARRFVSGLLPMPEPRSVIFLWCAGLGRRSASALRKAKNDCPPSFEIRTNDVAVSVSRITRVFLFANFCDVRETNGLPLQEGVGGTVPSSASCHDRGSPRGFFVVQGLHENRGSEGFQVCQKRSRVQRENIEKKSCRR
jgi:hypothetical protein